MTEAMAYRKQVMEKGDHELFNHFLDCCFPFKDDVLFKPVLASTVCCSSLFFFSVLCMKLIMNSYQFWVKKCNSWNSVAHGTINAGDFVQLIQHLSRKVGHKKDEKF